MGDTQRTKRHEGFNLAAAESVVDAAASIFYSGALSIPRITDPRLNPTAFNLGANWVNSAGPQKVGSPSNCTDTDLL